MSARRRSAKRGRAPTKLCKREVSIYDGVNLLGTIKIAADGKSTAYNAHGKRLGLFSSFHAASAAFNKSPVSGGVG
jgi:hypothetical protein